MIINHHGSEMSRDPMVTMHAAMKAMEKGVWRKAGKGKCGSKGGGKGKNKGKGASESWREGDAQSVQLKPTLSFPIPEVEQPMFQLLQRRA